MLFGKGQQNIEVYLIAKLDIPFLLCKHLYTQSRELYKDMPPRNCQWIMQNYHWNIFCCIACRGWSLSSLYNVLSYRVVCMQCKWDDRKTLNGAKEMQNYQWTVFGCNLYPTVLYGCNVIEKTETRKIYWCPFLWRQFSWCKFTKLCESMLLRIAMTNIWRYSMQIVLI